MRKRNAPLHPDAVFCPVISFHVERLARATGLLPPLPPLDPEIFKPVDMDKDPSVPSSSILAGISTGITLIGAGSLLNAMGAFTALSGQVVPFLAVLAATCVGAQCAYDTFYYVIESARRRVKAAFADRSQQENRSPHNVLALTHPRGLSMTIMPEALLFAALNASQRDQRSLGCDEDREAVRAFLHAAKSRPAPYAQPGSTLNLGNDRIDAVWKKCLMDHLANQARPRLPYNNLKSH